MILNFKIDAKKEFLYALSKKLLHDYECAIMGRVIFGGIIGAIIAFVWNFCSWVVLPWHQWTFQSFKNPTFVGWVIKENIKKDGVYIISHPDEGGKGVHSRGMTAKPKKESPLEQGPFVYAQIKRQGSSEDISNPKQYIISFLTQFLGAALISFLLIRMTQSSYGERLLFVSVIGLIVGVLGQVPSWNWFWGDHIFLLVNVADLLITWFLVGIILAAVARPKPERGPMM